MAAAIWMTSGFEVQGCQPLPLDTVRSPLMSGKHSGRVSPNSSMLMIDPSAWPIFAFTPPILLCMRQSA